MVALIIQTVLTFFAIPTFGTIASTSRERNSSPSQIRGWEKGEGGIPAPFSLVTSCVLRHLAPICNAVWQ